MRPMFGSRASGLTCTAPSIPPALRLIFYSPPIVTRPPLSASSKKRCMLRVTRDPGSSTWMVNPSYPKVVQELKQEGKLDRRSRCRTCPYLNNIVEQDHRAIKRRINASQGFRSFHGARRTIEGYEVVHMIRKGQVSWLPKRDVVGLVLFINDTLGLTTV